MIHITHPWQEGRCPICLTPLSYDPGAVAETQIRIHNTIPVGIVTYARVNGVLWLIHACGGMRPNFRHHLGDGYMFYKLD